MAEITIKDLKQRHIEDFLRARRDIQVGRAELNQQSYSDALVGFAAALIKKKVEGDEFRDALAKFVEGLLAMGEREQALTIIEEAGVRVRAAARCEWFDDLDEDDVGDLPAWEVDQLSDTVADAFNEAMTVPKN